MVGGQGHKSWKKGQRCRWYDENCEGRKSVYVCGGGGREDLTRLKSSTELTQLHDETRKKEKSLPLVHCWTCFPFESPRGVTDGAIFAGKPSNCDYSCSLLVEALCWSLWTLTGWNCEHMLAIGLHKKKLFQMKRWSLPVGRSGNTLEGGRGSRTDIEAKQEQIFFKVRKQNVTGKVP